MPQVSICLCLCLLRIPISLHRSGDYSSWGPGKKHYNTNQKMQYSMINVGEQKHRLRVSLLRLCVCESVCPYVCVYVCACMRVFICVCYLRWPRVCLLRLRVCVLGPIWSAHLGPV